MASDCLASEHPHKLCTPAPSLNSGTERPEATGLNEKGTCRGVAVRLTPKPAGNLLPSPSAPGLALRHPDSSELRQIYGGSSVLIREARATQGAWSSQA